MADTILKVFQCESAGVSLVTEDGKKFHWPAIAGVWKPHIGGGTPRDFGPCGDVLDRNCPLLFSHFERRYTYFEPVMPPAEECLLAPFHVQGNAVGTIWAIVHDNRPGARKFDNEDLRVLVRLGTFASAAYQVVEQLDALRKQAQERHEAQQAMRDMNEALLISSVRQHELAEQAQQAERKMHESEVRYRRLFESAKDGILILDADTGKITDANACMGTLLGTEARALLGKELWEIGLLRDKPASQAAVRELQDKGYMHYEHLPLETNGGRRVEVEVVANAYGEGQHSVIQCNIRDISERARLERKTHEQAEALADLHRRKDEFLAMLSHELRNPLAPILNAVQLLQLQRDESGLQQRARAIIERQLGQLVHLVDDLLEVSRISTGRIHLHREKLDMRAIVECGVETSRPVIEQRRHALALRLPLSPIWIDGDATRLEQVVVNLLNNAAKYTDEGGHIWLSLQQEGNEAVLQVRDSGVGIAPELMPRIFDLFTQAERSLARSQGGLGIGLSLVQRLVEMQGGKVAAHSALGQGSEFVVRLPVVLTAEPQPPSSPTEQARPTGTSLRVLVVDDNVDAVEGFEMLLRDSGHDVRSAYDGPTAIEAALDYRPNVVLLDIGLPGLDGYEVAKRMRQQPILQQVVLVAMTGYAQESDRERAQQAGFDHHLVKPVPFAQLQKILASGSKKAT